MATATPLACVLELACGRGAWTGQLLRHAADVTAVDASPEMLAVAAARADSQHVRFIQADLFAWEPDRRQVPRHPPHRCHDKTTLRPPPGRESWSWTALPRQWLAPS
jgi:SAM-dependent methyltransferase